MDTTNIRHTIGNYVRENVREEMFICVLQFAQPDVLEAIGDMSVDIWEHLSGGIHTPVVGQIKSTIYEHH